MKTKAKTISLLMALVLVSFLAGCRSGSRFPEQRAAPAKAPINIPALEERALKSPDDVVLVMPVTDG